LNTDPEIGLPDAPGKRSNRKQFLGFTGAILIFGLSGAFGASLLFILWTFLFQLRLFNDGQYVFVFAVTFPLGWLFGSVLGLVRGFAKAIVVKPAHSSVKGLGFVISGCLLTVIGSRGLGTFKSLVLGNISNRVACHSHRSVLVTH